MSDLVTVAIIGVIGTVITAVLKRGQDKISEHTEDLKKQNAELKQQVVKLDINVDGRLTQFMKALEQKSHTEGVEEERLKHL